VRLVSARPGARLEDVGAGVAEEVVARKDVVHLEAVPARETFTDIALQEGVVANEVLAFAIAENAIVRRSTAGLTMERNRHSSFPDRPRN
jgi:hypothetical protein